MSNSALLERAPRRRRPDASAQRPGPPPSGQGPGTRPPGPQRPRPGGPPTQPGGGRGAGGPGGYPPGQGGSGSGPFGSRRVLLIIAGVVVAVAAIIAGLVFYLRGSGSVTATPSFPSPPPSGGLSVPAQPSGSGSAGAPSSAGPSQGASSPGSGTSGNPSGGSTGARAALPAAAAIPQSVVVVPMRPEGDSDRGLYLVDTEGKIDRVQLEAASGSNANPMLPSSRTTIIYLNAGVLRVMASDGSGDRRLFNRDPAGCRHVEHASWSLADPNVLLIICRASKNRDSLLLVGMDGRLVRRLDAGKRHIGDAGVSPDGQTALFWATDQRGVDGGSLYTLPLIGTGAPKRLTQSAAGVDGDPAWSPDGTQIAFRRRVDNGTSAGNYEVFVMDADGSGLRQVTDSKAADFKPSWSPDGKSLLIISNRKSAFGGPGKTDDLWLIRISDGEVLTSLGLDAEEITRPFWTMR